MLTNLTDYLDETAAHQHVVGTWGFHSNLNFTRMSYQEANVWFFEQIFNFLRSFFGLVTPDNLELITYNASQHVKRDNLSHQTFLDELMLIMKGLKEYIWTLRVNLNIIGFVRTHHDPDNPVRLQIQEPCSFIIWGGPDENGFQNFGITYSLFSDTKLQGEDRMIWSLNQPILEKALKKWERQSGHRISVVDSTTGDIPIFEHGFGEPKAPAPPVPPASSSSPATLPNDFGKDGDFDFGF